ncbi:hypothetical protein M5D96_002347, partial [Drosophila gunungcola]
KWKVVARVKAKPGLKHEDKKSNKHRYKSQVANKQKTGESLNKKNRAPQTNHRQTSPSKELLPLSSPEN